MGKKIYATANIGWDGDPTFVLVTRDEPGYLYLQDCGSWYVGDKHGRTNQDEKEGGICYDMWLMVTGIEVPPGEYAVLEEIDG